MSAPPLGLLQGSSSTSQTEWLLRKRHMHQLSRSQIAWRRFLLYRRHQFLFLLSVFACTLFFRADDLPTGGAGGYLRSKLSPNNFPFPPSAADLQQLNAQLETAGGSNPDQLLLWAAERFPQSLVQVTSFGASGMVLMDKMHRLGLLSKVPTLSIDTLHLFDETHDLIAKVRKQYDLELHVYTPKGYRKRQEFDAEFGADLYKTDADKYGYLTKVEPMERALQQHHVQAWITGRRRSQGGERVHLPFVEYEAGRIKLNPLAKWSYDDVWKYIRKYQVPYNALHDKGYKSVGDVMTSRAVDPNAPERSGRFAGLNQTECGMHEHLEKVQRMKKEAEGKEEEFVMPTLPCPDCHDVDLNTFQTDIVQSTARDILLEFYSPLCGACQEFSPGFKRVVSKVKDSIQVSRFDVTESDLTDEMQEQGFGVETTPTLFLVQHNPLRLTLYEGDLNEFLVLDWLQQKSDNVNLSA